MSLVYLFFFVFFCIKSSSQAKGTKSTSFLTCVRNEVDLVPLACEDGLKLTSMFLFEQICQLEGQLRATLNDLNR